MSRPWHKQGGLGSPTHRRSPTGNGGAGGGACCSQLHRLPHPAKCTLPAPPGRPDQLQLGICNDKAASQRGEAAWRGRLAPECRPWTGEPPEPPSEELLLAERHPARLPAACAGALNIDRHPGAAELSGRPRPSPKQPSPRAAREEADGCPSHLTGAAGQVRAARGSAL